MATISTHNGSSVSRGHNIRNERCISKDGHIDLTRKHEIWIDEAPRAAYERIFGDAVRAYNETVRADRQIKDYYNHVRDDAKRKCCYEMIIGVYPSEGEEIPEENGKAIMQMFVQGWKERNPSLELIGAYYHADEQGKAPHVHIDYIPVAHGYKNGPKTQNALVKALGEQGFIKQGKATAQILWEKRENELLETICRKHGVTVEHPQAGKGVKHLHTDIYKAQKDLEAVQEKLADKKKELADIPKQIEESAEIAKMFFGDPDELREQALENQREINASETRLEEYKKEINAAETRLKALKGQILKEEQLSAIKIKKSPYGASKAVIEGTPEELRSLKATAERAEQAEKQEKEAKSRLLREKRKREEQENKVAYYEMLLEEFPDLKDHFLKAQQEHRMRQRPDRSR